MKRQKILIGCLGLLLLSSVAAALYMRRSHGERINELEMQLNVLREQAKKSAIDRRVSKQMEEIAYGQQALSEERSQEAIRQSEIAQEMTLRSEEERKKALEAQGIAEVSANEAMNAYKMVERQRMEADEQRRQAEHAKLVADTLNYISLGRTLGSQSYSIYQTGDKELGTMLAYASYLFTNDYGGDLYNPAVFEALTQAAASRRYWSIHNGSIPRIFITAKGGQLLTASTYGEIFIHHIEGGQMHTTRLMSDKNYCFRDVYAAPDGKIYAVSHTGHLVVINGKHIQTIYLERVDKPFDLEYMNDGKQLLISGMNSIAIFDTASDRIIGTRQLNYKVACAGRRDYKPLLFDNRGYMHLVSTLDDITNEKVPVSGQVTAFASSKNEHLTAYGMADGTVWLTIANGKMQKLVGHLSQVSKIKFNGRRLYTSSYDGKLLFWMTSEAQIKPITLFQSNSWLTDFTFNSDKNYIWTGEYNGNVSEYLISLPVMAERIRQNVKRNFTQEEWNYYVGKGIPYRKMRNERNEK